MVTVLSPYGTDAVWPSTIAARIVSSIFNYLTNRRIVFKTNDKITSSMPKYYALCFVQMLASAALVWSLSHITGILPSTMKIGVDLILFLVSYHIQRKWIFIFRR